MIARRLVVDLSSGLHFLVQSYNSSDEANSVPRSFSCSYYQWVVLRPGDVEQLKHRSGSEDSTQ